MFRFQDVGDAFNGTSNDGDFFYDFTPGQDRIQINAAAFGLNTLSSGSFVSGWSPAATTGGPTFLYSTASAYLLYDADGPARIAGPAGHPQRHPGHHRQRLHLLLRVSAGGCPGVRLQSDAAASS